jgi:hypothetical protein
MDREQVIDKYFRLISHDFAKARQLIKTLSYKKDPYLLHCIAWSYFNESLFNKDGSYKKYFVDRKLILSEKYIVKAFLIDDKCIDVLWTLGKVRKAFKQTEVAIYCYKRIIKYGARKVKKKDSCTYRLHAPIKVNDSKFELYRLYHDKGEFTLSKRYLAMYKAGLKNGLDTHYKPLNDFLMDSNNFSKLFSFPSY